MALNDEREKRQAALDMLREYPVYSEHYDAALEYLQPWQRDEGLDRVAREGLRRAFSSFRSRQR